MKIKTLNLLRYSALRAEEESKILAVAHATRKPIRF